MAKKKKKASGLNLTSRTKTPKKPSKPKSDAVSRLVSGERTVQRKTSVTPGGYIRLWIQLKPEESQAVTEAAEEDGISKAAVIRQAVRAYFKLGKRGRR